MGWSEEQALRADVNAIVIAYDGRLDMFEQVGWVKRSGGGAEPQNLPELGPGMLSRR